MMSVILYTYICVYWLPDYVAKPRKLFIVSICKL